MSQLYSFCPEVLTELIIKTSQKENSPDFFSVLCQIENLSTYKTFEDYAEFLFQRWVTRSQFQFKASEIHIIFDHPNRHGISPKDIERSRRDKNCKKNYPWYMYMYCTCIFIFGVW
jgi:hypothetical protein